MINLRWGKHSLTIYAVRTERSCDFHLGAYESQGGEAALRRGREEICIILGPVDGYALDYIDNMRL